jgi:hypothetical protein
MLRWISQQYELCTWLGTRVRADQHDTEFCAVMTVQFGMKLYNDQRNAQVFNVFIYLLLPYMFRAFF